MYTNTRKGLRPIIINLTGKGTRLKMLFIQHTGIKKFESHVHNGV